MTVGVAYVTAVGAHPAAATLAAHYGIPPTPFDPAGIGQAAIDATATIAQSPVVGAAATGIDVVNWLRVPANWARIAFVFVGSFLIIVGAFTMITGTETGATAAKLAAKAAIL
jgi:hypothetical protein